MATSGRDLGTIQRWMQAVLMHPDGVEGGVGSPKARGEIDVGPAELERVVTRSKSLSAADRLAVYCNAYYARLLECLREEFTALVHALGRELFDEFAFGYLQAYPSKSYTLHYLGVNFPRYLAETCPANEDSGWAAFLIDLAVLERVYNEVFDGKGVEGRELLTAERLLAIPPDRWPDARLVLADGFRLVELRSPVHEYISAIRRKEDPVPPNPAETLLAVHRRDYVVRRHPLTRPQYELLRALVAGESVGAAIGRAAEFSGPNLDGFAAELQEWFQGWAAEGFFQGVKVSP
jgi:hypothetical protein